MDALMAVSSVDGRYARRTAPLAKYLSEYGLIKHRLVVMTEHLLALSRHPDIPLRSFTPEEEQFLEVLQHPSLDAAQIIKDIETKGYGQHKKTNHDVKACELYLRDQLCTTSLADVVEWVHFGNTSEDPNNAAYALMLRAAAQGELLPPLESIHSSLKRFARRYAKLPMLARTHGQPATPTTLGKEFNVFAKRLGLQLRQLRRYKISVKFNSASGNYNAPHVAFPAVAWLEFTRDFVELHLEKNGNLPKLNPNYVTGQSDPHDTYAELFAILQRINTILIDLCQDIWRYISDNWIVQAVVSGEAGSSIMPHKVNPIDFENAEGNLGLANALLEFFCRKLPVSRLQRDLSDSTVERCFGTAFGHCLIAYTSIVAGLGKISANKPEIFRVLHAHPEVVTEAYQTVLRSIGYPDPYSALRTLARGHKLTMGDLHSFVRSLDIPVEVQKRMLAITPENYIGLAPRLARM
jgi:adenylosuccinate lyase